MLVSCRTDLQRRVSKLIYLFRIFYMLILLLLIGSGMAILCGALLWLLPNKKKITSEKESFEESSQRRSHYLDEMRRERLLNAAANELRNRP